MPNRLEFLDASRGLAAISVVLSHFFGAYGLFPFLKNYENSLLHIFWHGEGAVSFFFVLSGYVLSKSLLKNIDNLNVCEYLTRRLFRIMPLFIFCILISFFSLNFYLSHLNVSTFPKRSSWILEFWTYPKYFKDIIKEAILIRYIPSQTQQRFLPQDWTLRIELIYSLIIPVLLFILKKNNKFFILISIFLILEYSSLSSGFIFGIFLAYSNTYIINKIKNFNQLVRLAIFVAGIILYTSPYDMLQELVKYHPDRKNVLQSLGSAAILISLLSNDILQKILTGKIFVFFGKISYGIYLTHFFILIGFMPQVFIFLNKFYNYDENLTRIIGLLILSVSTILISFITYQLVELPFIRIGKKIKFKNNIISI